ncbi:MAG: TonB-dependent receptor, partial [Candidatus Eisenbacteria sp.]|nr:TonB-dependent receptor [Candidatus Eisenbacteria bacterium]
LGIVSVLYAGSFSRAEDTDTELALAYRPEFSQLLAATLEIERVTGTFRVRHVGDVYADGYESSQLSAYSVADFRALVDLPPDGVALRFDVLNLMDERYETRAGYEMPGREWRASLLLGWEDGV